LRPARYLNGSATRFATAGEINGDFMDVKIMLIIFKMVFSLSRTAGNELFHRLPAEIVFSSSIKKLFKGALAAAPSLRYKTQKVASFFTASHRDLQEQSCRI
jgi:hypothetical protein